MSILPEKEKLAEILVKTSDNGHFIEKWLPWQACSYLITLYSDWAYLKTYEPMVKLCFCV